MPLHTQHDGNNKKDILTGRSDAEAEKKSEPSFAGGLVGGRTGTDTLANSLAVAQTVKTWELPCDPTVLLLGMYSGEAKTHIHTKTCTERFRAALLIIARK